MNRTRMTQGFACGCGQLVTEDEMRELGFNLANEWIEV